MWHRFSYASWWTAPAAVQECILYQCALTALVLSPSNLENSNILSVPWSSALKRPRRNVFLYFINENLFSNKAKKPVQWNNLMLHFLLVDTLPIFFRFPPKCLEKSLVIVRKKLGLIKLTSASSEKTNKQELVKILLQSVLNHQVVKFISILCCCIIPIISACKTKS